MSDDHPPPLDCGVAFVRMAACCKRALQASSGDVTCLEATALAFACGRGGPPRAPRYLDSG